MTTCNTRGPMTYLFSQEQIKPAAQTQDIEGQLVYHNSFSAPLRLFKRQLREQGKASPTMQPNTQGRRETSTMLPKLPEAPQHLYLITASTWP